MWCRSSRGIGLVLASVVCLLGPTAVARADATWKGAGTTALWSNPSNWSGAAPTTGDAGNLTFPELGTGACPTSETCYTASNDLTGLSADSLTVDDNDGYTLDGNALSIGSGGITAKSYEFGAANEAEIGMPVTLTAPQTWTFNGTPEFAEGLEFSKGVTGSDTTTLAIDFAEGAFLEFDGDAEVGATTASTTGTETSGIIDLYSAKGSSPSLNGSDGNLVTLDPGVDLDASAVGSRSGALTSNGASITVGGGNANDGTLAVNGAVTLDSSSSLLTYIDQDGTTPSADYSQLTANGNVTLGGDLELVNGHDSGGTCAALTPGDTATLISTTGSVTGSFSNVTNGLDPMAQSCNTSPPQAQINYAAHTVTATIVTPTSTTLAVAPSSAATNQPVTLTATISPTASVAAPSTAQGTVAFANNGVAIPGCSAQLTSISGNGFVATCTTSFSPGQQSLTATYSNGPDYLGSQTSSATSLSIGRDATATTLNASTISPQAGTPVTFAAAVTPADSGAAQPTGQVEFVQDGMPIAGCASQPLDSSTTASCTTTLAAGTHSITADYPGDGDFAGSTSPIQLVTATAPPTSTRPPPPPSPSATTSPATAITKTSATLRGVVNTAGAAVSWQFELGRGSAYSKGTAIQTLGAGRGSVPVSATIKGLAPATAYRFVLVVMQASPATTASGSPFSFTTRPNGALLMTAGRLTVVHGSVRVPESCTSASACGGRFSITVNGTSCATASYRVKAHRRTTVAGALSGACIKRLRSATHHRLSAIFSTAPQTGQLRVRKPVALALG